MFKHAIAHPYIERGGTKGKGGSGGPRMLVPVIKWAPAGQWELIKRKNKKGKRRAIRPRR